jgi:putative membrane protein
MNKMVGKSKYNVYIWIVSIIIPLVVAFLFTVRIPNVESLSFLPPIYATINGLTSILLITALWAIKNKKIK